VAVSEHTTPFGDVLRRVRSAAALSQEDLAGRAGLSRKGISDLERGARRAPRLETVRLLADALALGEDDRSALLAAARPALLHNRPTVAGLLPRVSLPVPLTRLIGRESELTVLQAALRSDAVRLLTLTGAGGTGKTRLAVAVAVGLRDIFPDGTFFVDLSPLTDPALVIPTIAAVLGVRESAGKGLLEALCASLASKRLLLVLDNCERVLPAARDIITLFAASPGLTVFATSREPFHVRGEREFPLMPLSLPTSNQLPAIEELACLPAVALFVERATAVQPDFALTRDNAAAIAAICQRLDGLPLAIELAAARVKVLPPAALLTRLERRLPLLTGGPDLPARQRTMRDAIAWSYDLLAPEQQTLFRHLSVFIGGFTLSAAEALAAPGEESPVLAGIVALVEKSLLQVLIIDDEPRYRMLETVREFGLERLAASGEADDIRRRHADYFLSLCDGLGQGIQMLLSQANLTHVAAEHDNVQHALVWFDEHNQIDALLRLSSLLYGLWIQRGLYREAMHWVDRALARSSQVASSARCQALVVAGNLAVFQGDYAGAEGLLDEALALAQELGDLVLIGEAVAYSAFISYRRGAYGRAEDLLDETLRLTQERTDAAPGAMVLQLLGDLALAQEQFERAKAHYQQAIDHFQTVSFAWGLSDAQAGLAGVSMCTGNLTRASALYAESLGRANDLDFTHLVASSVLGLAAVAAASGGLVEGARLLGAAEGMAASLGALIYPRDLRIHERCLTALTGALGEARLAAAREAGGMMSIEQAVIEAWAVVDAVTGAEPAERSCLVRTNSQTV
jgi:predicted ATPase/DNA-binding XRE family transcriptional regulator